MQRRLCDEDARDAGWSDQDARGKRTGEHGDIRARVQQSDRAHQRLRWHEARKRSVLCGKLQRRGRGTGHDQRHEDHDAAPALGGDDREHGRDDRRPGLRRKQQPAPIDAIGEHTCSDPRDESRDRARETEEPQVQRRACGHAFARGELHREPAEREELHLPADLRRGERGQQRSEVLVCQRRERRKAACAL
jgi:hypothetical protein